jgi:hypothetical protein
MTSLNLDARAHDEAKRLLGQAAPHIKSSHRTEALARGLGYATNAALQAALADGPVKARSHHARFEGFLRDRGHSPETLQAALFRDAVILACGGDVDGIKVPPYLGPRRFVGRCSLCQDRFFRHSSSHVTCHECEERGPQVPNVGRAASILSDHVKHLMVSGIAPNLDHLRARPGWTDILDGTDLADRTGQALAIKGVLNTGDPRTLTPEDRRLIESFGLSVPTSRHAQASAGRR